MAKSNNNTTKETILKTAGSLFSQRGYFGVSMQDIADELSITKAALYYHFESKEALTQELLQKTVNDLKLALRESRDKGKIPSDKLFNIVKTFLDFKINHPELSLLVSLGFTTDEKVPFVQFIQDLRLELTKFLRELIGGIDFVRKITYKGIFLITSTILGLVLSPFYGFDNSKQIHEFTELLMSGTEEKSYER